MYITENHVISIHMCYFNRYIDYATSTSLFTKCLPRYTPKLPIITKVEMCSTMCGFVQSSNHCICSIWYSQCAFHTIGCTSQCSIIYLSATFKTSGSIINLQAYRNPLHSLGIILYSYNRTCLVVKSSYLLTATGCNMRYSGEAIGALSQIST